MDAFLKTGVTIYAAREGMRPLADSGILSMLRVLAIFQHEYTEPHSR